MPPATLDDLGIIVDFSGPGTTPPDLVELLKKYVSQFEAPHLKETPHGTFLGTRLCACGAQLDGLLGSFTWALRHGEFYCSQCKRHGMAHHYIYWPPEDRSEPAVTVRFVPLLYRQEAA